MQRSTEFIYTFMLKIRKKNGNVLHILRMMRVILSRQLGKKINKYEKYLDSIEEFWD